MGAFWINKARSLITEIFNFGILYHIVYNIIEICKLSLQRMRFDGRVFKLNDFSQKKHQCSSRPNPCYMRNGAYFYHDMFHPTQYSTMFTGSIWSGLKMMNIWGSLSRSMALWYPAVGLVMPDFPRHERPVIILQSSIVCTFFLCSSCAGVRASASRSGTCAPGIT